MSIKSKVTGLNDWLSIRRPHSIFIYSAIVGVLSGLIAMLLDGSIHALASIISNSVKENIPSQDVSERILLLKHRPVKESLIIILLPALGGLLTGIIIAFFSKEVSGNGVDQVIHAFHNNEGQMNTRSGIFKTIATFLTVGSGGSGGKEGPIAYIGASIGVAMSNFINAGARARRTLMLSGIAAGFGAVFRAPLGGALTATEMIYKEDIETDALIPCFISSVTAFIVYTSYAGYGWVLHSSAIIHFNVSELLYFLLLGPVCFLFGYLFLKGYRNAKSFIKGIKLPVALKPMIGGLFIGIFSLLFFEVSGEGLNFLGFVLNSGKINLFGWGIIGTILTFLTLALLKIVATTFTLGSGGSAGIFGPSLFIGAMLGGAVGSFAQYMSPESQINIAPYMLVGMGAFYAGVANATLAGVIMVCEMSGSYVLLPPLILVSIFSMLLSKKLSFHKQVLNRFKSPAHYWDMKFDVIDNIRINEKFNQFRDLAVVENSLRFSELLVISRKIQASDFVVTDHEKNYIGMLSLRKINMETISGLDQKNISDYADKNIPALPHDSSLGAALKIMRDHDIDKVGITVSKKIAGYLRFRDIFTSYTETIESKY